MKEKNVNLNGKTVLITGAAGFIGSHLAVRLLDEFEDIKVVGYDNVNDYYDVRLKEERLANLSKYENFIFVKGDIADKKMVDETFAKYKPAVVVNLAAQAGVRYSIENPGAYIEANVIGFYNILEACRHSDPKVEHLVYASSSSVYGGNTKLPFSTKDQVDHPLSLYAATKKSNELFAYSYSNLYGMATTGLRFFTVYGPMGRPDMALFLFADKLLKGETIQIFNYGNCKRDFTYVDDIVTGVVNVMQSTPDEDEKGNRYMVYNIGNHNPENLMDFVDILQKELVAHGVLPEDFDFEAHRELLPMQPGDVEATFADVDDLMRDFDFKPDTDLRDGIRNFVDWYAGYVKRRDQ
ncbi:GDP-mannose 4,6-dehydratase [Butyrivibrio sp. AE3004]|uniref:GDP-mannose 4,6-dehydratase n=1 Tax=Butyrivibrio sp. AE3004 TaxID=1506994 RepID=UPI0004946E96|nr:NAD-dependent epimerase/dehydratase family protein [Butyrivibrio sp. AE3004]